MPQSQRSRPLCVLFGPRTRLGLAWLKTAHAKNADLLLVARSAEEANQLRLQFPEHRIHIAGETISPIGNPSVEIIGCAIGLIHPAATSWQTERAHADRDLGVIQCVLDAATGPVRIVFVSSVLALMTRRVMWYGGWKNVIEGALRKMVSTRPNATLVVLYPGRLVETSLKSLGSRLYTTFDYLAAQITWAACNAAAKHRLIGWDSRIWILYQSLPVWMLRRHLHIPAKQ